MRRQKEDTERKNNRTGSNDLSNLAVRPSSSSAARRVASAGGPAASSSPYQRFPRLRAQQSTDTTTRGSLYPTLDDLPSSVRSLAFDDDPTELLSASTNTENLSAHSAPATAPAYSGNISSQAIKQQQHTPTRKPFPGPLPPQHSRKVSHDPPGLKEDAPSVLNFSSGAGGAAADRDPAARNLEAIVETKSENGPGNPSMPSSTLAAPNTSAIPNDFASGNGGRRGIFLGTPSRKSASLEDDYPDAVATWDAHKKASAALNMPNSLSATTARPMKKSSSLLDEDDEDDDAASEIGDQVPPLRFHPTAKRQVSLKKPPPSSSAPMHQTNLPSMPVTKSPPPNNSNNHQTAESPSSAPAWASSARTSAVVSPYPARPSGRTQSASSGGMGSASSSLSTLVSSINQISPSHSQHRAPAPFPVASTSIGSATNGQVDTSHITSSSSNTIQEKVLEPIEPSVVDTTGRRHTDPGTKSTGSSYASTALSSSASLPSPSPSPRSNTLGTRQSMQDGKEDDEMEETEEEKQLRLAKQASLQEASHQSTDKASSSIITDEMIETASENARTLQSICQQGVSANVDPSILEYYLRLCTNAHETISHGGVGNLSIEKVDKILAVNDMLLTAIEAGQSHKKSSQKKPALAATESLAIVSLVAKKDIFSLICMLRAQQEDQRLEAAMALMHFSRNAESERASEEDRRLRNEILSSGGLHSLLTLFRARNSNFEIKVVVALAIAYILPSFIVMSSSSLLKPGLGLKIMECLRFLGQAHDVTTRGERISEDESFRAAAIGLTTFWVNQLDPMLRSQGGITARNTNDSFNWTTGHRRGRSTPGHVFDQRKEAIGTQELLEMTVSLVIAFTRHASSGRSEGVADPVLLVEQICAVEMARPIAVREGVLKILVGWIENGGNGRKTLAAAHSLQHLTSIKDKYMAGWIHSQMVNEGALRSIVRLTRDNSLEPPARLAIAQILASLCVAPHTRAAVVEADCIHFLVDILFEHMTSQDVALYSTQALLQLAAGAITRASALGGDDLQSFASPDKRDKVIDDIVERGAIGSLVEIAIQHKGKLRNAAIESLRVLSEDISPKRKTRLKLCDDGAARAIGIMLVDTLPSVEDSLRSQRNVNHDVMQHLHEALCVLSNLLDPLVGSMTSSKTRNSRQISDPRDPDQLLVSACIHTIESGGLDSLIRIALLPMNNKTSFGPLGTSTLDLIAEACQSISSVSPLLMSTEISSKRLSCWASDVFLTLDHILHLLPGLEEKDDDSVVDIHVTALLGISALAAAAPLKIRIIDRLLPHLLEAKNAQDQRDVSNAAGQAFQSLDFAEAEVAHQVAGNNAALLADWFCLQRSLFIQAMARREIRDGVLHIWESPFRESSASTGPTKLVREVSDRSKSDDDKSFGTYFFDNIIVDDIPSKEIEEILQQYDAMFGCDRPRGNHRTILDDKVAETSSESSGLLETQIYPLGSAATETDWLLRHNEYLKSNSKPLDQLNEHVEKLLAVCFPSRLIRDHVVPIKALQTDASYNFRALMMPQRRYFSFRREGQLLSRICGKDDEPDNIQWTLGFTNSAFAGEFAESLVQALYLCPMVCGLSFSRNHKWHNVMKSQEDGETQSDDGASLLGNIVGSLPPWISNLTFDGILGDRELKSLIKILDTMGTLSAGQRSQAPSFKEGGQGQEETIQTEGQGRFWCFAVRNCPHLGPETWQDFFGLIGKVGRGSKYMSRRPLSSLKALDLSGNGLGDEICASLLEIVLEKDSGCRIEQLDLSGNRLANATRTLKALRNYVHFHRSDHFQGVRTHAESWSAPLHTLLLGCNALQLGGAWLEIVTLLKNNALPLKRLDLSSNKITMKGASYETDTFLSCIQKNTRLVNLDLSGNRLSSDTIDDMIGRLGRATIDMRLAFFDLSNNEPPLTDRQQSMLKSFCDRSRLVLVQRLVSEKEEHSRLSMLGTSQLSISYDSEYLREPSSYGLNYEPSFSNVYASNGNERTVKLGDNMITVLFSAPLVYKDRHGSLRPFAKLDFDMERELIMQCLKEASRDIELSFDTATHHRLLAAISKGCSCLHYSGHGHEKFLPFEDGSGGPHWFEVNNIRSLIAGREGGAPFRFVFVSACYSGLAGETFASAGVPHVVCCKQEFELKDTAALAFTRQFYLALAVGHTVKESFEQGRKAVRATPNLRDAESETEKFVLLPRDGNHDVPIFDARPLLQWPHAQSSRKRKGKAKTALSVFNKMQENPSTSPPQFFLGREVDMYLVLNLVLEKRLVSIVGETGVGRSSLACAVCHHINERASTIAQIDHILYVKARQSRKQSRVRALVQKLMKRLVESHMIDPEDADTGPDVDIESLFDVICQGLRDSKCLIVFDRTELLKDSDETREFPMLLSNLFRETRYVHVLLTGREPLGIPSIGGQVEHHFCLGPLNYANTVKLFSCLCPYIHTPTERRRLCNALVRDGDEAELLPSDPGLGKSTRKIFSLLGNGTPAHVEKAAYVLSKDDVMALMSGSVPNVASVEDYA